MRPPALHQLGRRSIWAAARSPWAAARSPVRGNGGSIRVPQYIMAQQREWSAHYLAWIHWELRAKHSTVYMCDVSPRHSCCASAYARVHHACLVCVPQSTARLPWSEALRHIRLAKSASWHLSCEAMSIDTVAERRVRPLRVSAPDVRPHTSKLSEKCIDMEGR